MWSLILLFACHSEPDTTTCSQQPLTPACRSATNALDCVSNGGATFEGGFAMLCVD